MVFQQKDNWTEYWPKWTLIWAPFLWTPTKLFNTFKTCTNTSKSRRNIWRKKITWHVNCDLFYLRFDDFIIVHMYIIFYHRDFDFFGLRYCSQWSNSLIELEWKFWSKFVYIYDEILKNKSEWTLFLPLYFWRKTEIDFQITIHAWWLIRISLITLIEYSTFYGQRYKGIQIISIK